MPYLRHEFLVLLDSLYPLSGEGRGVSLLLWLWLLVALPEEWWSDSDTHMAVLEEGALPACEHP